MRIVAGKWGGRRIAAPRGAATRPTSDRVREALFSILGARVEGSRVLDLYAGSGALGLEALSRGAGSATFVENRAATIAVLKANLATLDARAEVHQRDALAFLRAAATSGPHYDLALLDPPYALAPRIGPELSAALPAVLAPGAVVVSESDRRHPLDLDLPLTDERRYGDTLIRIHEPE